MASIERFKRNSVLLLTFLCVFLTLSSLLKGRSFLCTPQTSVELFSTFNVYIFLILLNLTIADQRQLALNMNSCIPCTFQMLMNFLRKYNEDQLCFRKMWTNAQSFKKRVGCSVVHEENGKIISGILMHFYKWCFCSFPIPFYQ